MPSDITINGITVTLDAISTGDVSSALWEAGQVENIGRYYASDYLRRMVTACAETALWSDASHDDDTEGTGEFAGEIDDLRFGYSPDYEESLPAETLAELETDVESFMSGAWIYLAAENISPEDAGHNFQLSRNGHGTGFWDRGYTNGDALHSAAQTFGTFGLQVSGHDDDIKVYGHHN